MLFDACNVGSDISKALYISEHPGGPNISYANGGSNISAENLDPLLKWREYVAFKIFQRGPKISSKSGLAFLGSLACLSARASLKHWEARAVRVSGPGPCETTF